MSKKYKFWKSKIEMLMEEQNIVRDMIKAALDAHQWSAIENPEKIWDIVRDEMRRIADSLDVELGDIMGTLEAMLDAGEITLPEVETEEEDESELEEMLRYMTGKDRRLVENRIQTVIESRARKLARKMVREGEMIGGISLASQDSAGGEKLPGLVQDSIKSIIIDAIRNYDDTTDIVELYGAIKASLDADELIQQYSKRAVDEYADRVLTDLGYNDEKEKPEEDKAVVAEGFVLPRRVYLAMANNFLD